MFQVSFCSLTFKKKKRKMTKRRRKARVGVGGRVKEDFGGNVLRSKEKLE